MHGENADAHHNAANFRRQRECRLPISKPIQAGDDRNREYDPNRQRSKALIIEGSSARIEIKVRSPQCGSGADEAMNSQPYRVEPSVARARAKWRMPIQVPNRHTAPAIRTRT